MIGISSAAADHRTLTDGVLRNGNGPPVPPGPGACAVAPDPALPLAEQIIALAGRFECVATASPIGAQSPSRAARGFGGHTDHRFDDSIRYRGPAPRRAAIE